MSSKKTTTSSSQNSLPSWLTSPYQAATTQATTLAAQPAIGAGTQGVLDQTLKDSASGSASANAGLGTVSNLAQGNFGDTALTQAANGDFVKSNPFAQNGGLDTGYIDQSLLNKTASGDFLTADSNPYIRGVADQGADAAQARINAQFGAAGRTNGSGLYAQLFGKGIADASNSVYAQNYANERQLQQGAQTNLLGAEQTAHESALGRQSSAYESERQRQQAAAGGLVNTQLSASSQIPSLISSALASDQAGLSAGNYQDNADMERLRQYTTLLSSLAQPFGQQNSSQTQTTSGLGSTIGSIAQLAGAVAAPFTGGASLGIGGAVNSAINGGGGGSIIQPWSGANLPSWLPS